MYFITNSFQLFNFKMNYQHYFNIRYVIDMMEGYLQVFLQSLLNDFTSLLQWNRQIYSPNEQNRVEIILPLLREQITTTDGYVSNVSQVKKKNQEFNLMKDIDFSSN